MLPITPLFNLVITVSCTLCAMFGFNRLKNLKRTKQTYDKKAYLNQKIILILALINLIALVGIEIFDAECKVKINICGMIAFFIIFMLVQEILPLFVSVLGIKFIQNIKKKTYNKWVNFSFIWTCIMAFLTFADVALMIYGANTINFSKVVNMSSFVTALSNKYGLMFGYTTTALIYGNLFGTVFALINTVNYVMPIFKVYFLDKAKRKHNQVIINNNLDVISRENIDLNKAVQYLGVNLTPDEIEKSKQYKKEFEERRNENRALRREKKLKRQQEKAQKKKGKK